MALSVTIDGVNRVSALRDRSLRITKTNGLRAGRCDLVLVSTAVQIDATLVIADGATTYFSGNVRSLATDEVRAGGFLTTVTGLDAGGAVSETDAPFSLSDRATPEAAYTDMMTAFTDQPYCWWRLGEPSGTTATDAMAFRNGTYVGSPTLGVAGAMTTGNTAVTLNGSSQYVDCGAAMLAGQADFSIAAWAKTSYSGANQVVYAEAIAGGGTPYVRFYISTSGRPTVQYRDNAGTEDTFAPTSGNWADGAWHHFAATKYGTALTIYVDGVSVRTATLTAGNTLSGGLSAHIGHDPIAGLHFHGSLDEVMVWRTWTTDREARALYQARDTRRYARLSHSLTSDAGALYWSGTITTYEAGFVPNARFGIWSANNGLVPGPLGYGFYALEVTLTWQSTTVILYTIAYGSDPGVNQPRLADAFP